LAAVLAGWLERSGAARIGDVGTFGQCAWSRVDVAGAVVALNADTCRAAAEAFVRAGATDPDRLWLVVASYAAMALPIRTPSACRRCWCPYLLLTA
jgi:hypothetical protein